MPLSLAGLVNQFRHDTNGSGIDFSLTVDGPRFLLFQVSDDFLYACRLARLQQARNSLSYHGMNIIHICRFIGTQMKLQWNNSG